MKTRPVGSTDMNVTPVASGPGLSDTLLAGHIKAPVGPEFMAPPIREAAE